MGRSVFVIRSTIAGSPVNFIGSKKAAVALEVSSGRSANCCCGSGGRGGSGGSGDVGDVGGSGDGCDCTGCLCC